MEKVNPVCIICGVSRRGLLYADDQWQVYQCENCGLGVLDPRPGKDELNRLYTENYFQSHYQEELALNSAKMKQRLRQEDHRLRFFYKFKKNGKVLDVGCGRGYFLLACRKQGYEVEGIDISETAAMHVRKEFKIPVHVSALKSIKLETASFDVITMWHSLEHTTDPNLYIQSAHKWLKKEGILVVDVPNYEGYDARKYWRDWAHWDLPFHFYHFTPKAIVALLEKHGFEVIRKKSYLSDYVKGRLESKAVPSFLARIIARCYSGGGFAVVARKIMDMA